MDRRDLILKALGYTVIADEPEEYSIEWAEQQNVQHIIALLLDPTVDLVELQTIDPRSEIAHIWSIEDVKGERPELTDEQALRVLKRVDRQKDSTQGINWDTINNATEQLYPELDSMLEPDGTITLCSYEHDFYLTPSAFYQILDEMPEEDRVDFLDNYTWDWTMQWHEMYKDREGVTIVDSVKDTDEEA